MRSAIEHSFSSCAHARGHAVGDDRLHADARHGRAGPGAVLGVHDADRDAAGQRRVVRARDLGLVRVPAVVDEELHRKRVDDVGGRADVVGVGMRDPEHVDRRPAEVDPQAVEQVALARGADVAAAAATGRVTGVDEDVGAARKVDEGGEALAHVVEVDAEGVAGPAGRVARSADAGAGASAWRRPRRGGR